MNSNECDSDIYNNLKILKKLKKNIGLLKSDIKNENERKKKVISHFKQELANCEMNLSFLQEELDISRKEICSMANVLVSVRLGDLLYEITKLSGIGNSDIRVKVDTDLELLGIHSEGEMFNLFNQSEGNYNVILMIEGVNVNKSGLVMYLTHFPLNRDLKEKNNGSLLNHCSTKVVNNFGRVYTKVVIDKDIEDIVINFKLYHLDKLESYYWYPSELFTQAVINCLNKDNKKSKKRVKK